MEIYIGNTKIPNEDVRVGYRKIGSSISTIITVSNAEFDEGKKYDIKFITEEREKTYYDSIYNNFKFINKGKEFTRRIKNELGK